LKHPEFRFFFFLFGQTTHKEFGQYFLNDEIMKQINKKITIIIAISGMAQ